MQDKLIADYAAMTLSQLRAEGYEITDSDVVWLNDIARRIITPDAKMQLARGRPVKAGNAVLWPLTVSAQYWFDSIGCHYVSERDALAYAMAHGDSEELWQATQAQVYLWAARCLTCTADQLELALAECATSDMRPAGPPEKSQRKIEIQELAAMMQACHGGELDKWERHCSIGYIFSVADILAAQAKEKGGLTDILRARANVEFADAIDAIKSRGVNA